MARVLLLLVGSCLLFAPFSERIRACAQSQKEPERGRERERKRNIDVRQNIISCLSYIPCNPTVCPDQESNQGPFTLRDNTQPSEPHPSGQVRDFHTPLKLNSIRVGILLFLMIFLLSRQLINVCWFFLSSSKDLLIDFREG
ncbi:hypothetical protein HJG60_009034 [Phyllostomus discolor]|uniref:Uncharacterized protein n=1 Tax=Phyllostomus discolor TaxID=89673 RepID=A0A833YS18_9CHIR|nr:hypothetical protein HJG60_009034 [Phyllostomus discolor]